MGMAEEWLSVGAHCSLSSCYKLCQVSVGVSVGVSVRMVGRGGAGGVDCEHHLQ